MWAGISLDRRRFCDQAAHLLATNWPGKYRFDLVAPFRTRDRALADMRRPGSSRSLVRSIASPVTIPVVMDAAEILKSVQFLVDDQGRPRAVQLGMPEWRKLLEFLEDQEDRAVVKEALQRLRLGPASSGALSWEQIRDTWEAEPDPGR